MSTKVCLDCKEDKPIEVYGSNGTLPSGKARYKPRYKPRCKPCNAVYETVIFRSKLQRIIGSTPACKHCGYDEHFVALDFHHRDPSVKERQVSLMRNYSEAKLRAEIEKCDILCAICHRLEHLRLGDYR